MNMDILKAPRRKGGENGRGALAAGKKNCGTYQKQPVLGLLYLPH